MISIKHGLFWFILGAVQVSLVQQFGNEFPVLCPYLRINRENKENPRDLITICAPGAIFFVQARLVQRLTGCWKAKES